jgi:hypothetical protein
VSLANENNLRNKFHSRELEDRLAEYTDICGISKILITETQKFVTAIKLNYIKEELNPK